MFEQVLTFNSENAKKQRANNKDEDFTTRFERSIILPKGKNYKVALLKLTGSYSWHNIEAQRNNTQIQYSNDAGLTFQLVNFPDGIYSYSDINNYLHDIMRINGDFILVDGVEIFPINISFSFTTFRAVIEITNPLYQLDLISVGFGSLLGFTTLLITGSSEGDVLPNINNSLDNLFVHCSLVSNSIVDGAGSNILFSFSTARLSRGFPYEFEPRTLQFTDIGNDIISEVRFFLTDINERIIDLNGIPMSYTIMIQEA
jgi:hypothetical protein